VTDRISPGRIPHNAFSLPEDYLIKYSAKVLISEMNGRFRCASSRRRRTAVNRRFQPRHKNRIDQVNSGPKFWTPALILDVGSMRSDALLDWKY
jgi:hypothetical protein